ncbi:FecR family protein [Mucilaginibacter sp. HD30]
MEDDQILRDVFQRYLNNRCSKQEVNLLLKRFLVDGNEEALRELIADKLKNYSLAEDQQLHYPKKSFDAAFNDLLSKIADEEAFQQETSTHSVSHRPLIVQITAVIIVALLVFEGWYSYYKPRKPQQLARVDSKRTSIAPGGNKAVLTLQDGSTIVLNDAENGTLARQGNTSIVKLANGQLVYNEASGPADKVLYNTMTTPRGGQYKLTLPDGTNVWLNSASSINYPTAFVGNERKVAITGEAYFEVAKDKSKPFHVVAGNQSIEVLGTHFNVMAYADEENIKTTLLEGSVKISEHNNISILRPGDQAVVASKGGITVKPANIDEAMAWKNGYFKFSRVDIKHIMRQISRWYDVEVVYEGDMPYDEFVGKIGRSENISQILHVLELEHVHFKIEGKKIIVLP